MEQLDSHLTDFPWNIYSEGFDKSFWHIGVLNTLLEASDNLELVKKFPTFCGASLYITAFSKAARYQIFWVVVGLERGPLSLVSSIEELLE